MIGEKTPVGEVRPSQLLWTYGPGALVDLPNLSVVTLAIDRWDVNRCQPIEEARLLAAVRQELVPQVESLRMPPFQKNEGSDPFSAEAFIGVPVRPFPRWLRCVKCGLLSAYDLGLFECKENRFRPERTRFVHKDCKGSKGDQPAKDADAVPARFLLACRNGHLDDFQQRPIRMQRDASLLRKWGFTLNRESVGHVRSVRSIPQYGACLRNARPRKLAELPG